MAFVGHGSESCGRVDLGAAADFRALRGLTNLHYFGGLSARMRRERRTVLLCLGPDAGGGFEVREAPRRRPAPDEIEVAVEAASVNPIDVRRAEGYGVRLLSLLGAGKFPMVLGNDFTGTVVTTGTKVSALKPGERVYGLKRTSGEGTHASHVLVKAVSVLPAAAGQDLRALAAIPYSF